MTKKFLYLINLINLLATTEKKSEDYIIDLATSLEKMNILSEEDNKRNEIIELLKNNDNYEKNKIINLINTINLSNQKNYEKKNIIIKILDETNLSNISKNDKDKKNEIIKLLMEMNLSDSEINKIDEDKKFMKQILLYLDCLQKSIEFGLIKQEEIIKEKIEDMAYNNLDNISKECKKLKEEINSRKKNITKIDWENKINIEKYLLNIIKNLKLYKDIYANFNKLENLKKENEKICLIEFNEYKKFKNTQNLLLDIIFLETNVIENKNLILEEKNLIIKTKLEKEKLKIKEEKKEEKLRLKEKQKEEKLELATKQKEEKLELAEKQKKEKNKEILNKKLEDVNNGIEKNVIKKNLRIIRKNSFVISDKEEIFENKTLKKEQKKNKKKLKELEKLNGRLENIEKLNGRLENIEKNMKKILETNNTILNKK